jgi:MoaA/NifB/PqqE/SkfB family radical SAM enzyme
MKGHVNKDLKLQHIDIKNIYKIPLEKMPNLQSIELIGNFGDPLMHPRLNEILDYFTTQTITISTNASLRDKEWWEKLGHRKNVKVNFAIDGLEDTHHLYRRETDYNKIIKNAKSFISAGGTAIWQYIVFKHNQHQLEQARHLSQTLGFKEINFKYSDRFELANNFKVYDKGKYLYDLEKASTQNTLKEKLNSPKSEKQWKKVIQGYTGDPIECVWSKNKKIYIHSDSFMFPCCYIGNIQSGRYIEKTLFSKIIKDVDAINLNKNNFEQVIKSEAFQKYLPESLKGKPFSHPVCIEYCNKDTGRIANQDLISVNM